MKVFKFGGASVKDAQSVKNIASILRKSGKEKIVVVISAMGKTTNSLENLVSSYTSRKSDAKDIFSHIKEYHFRIMEELFGDRTNKIFDEVNNSFVEIEWILEEEPKKEYDFIYDQIVSIGEIVATKIISAFLNSEGLNNQWLDVRDCLITDNSYREGKIDWETTMNRFNSVIPGMMTNSNLVITQGFIGGTTENYTTTLGREGSDYTAAIIAYCLEAQELCIWKDVPGVLNADPKYFSDAKKLEKVSYQDAIELAYYGASVIHPKTIQPLQNKSIPLKVKSFLTPEESGTLVSAESQTEPLIPSFIFKENQALISIAAKDFSFIIEENLSDIFKLFSWHKMKINLMQNSAISFSVCTDDDPKKIHLLIDDLKNNFKVLYNENLKLLTIRHYDNSTLEKLTKGKTILVEQRSRHTIQLVLKD